MAEIYVVDVVAEALKQVGKSCGKTNEYSAELDAVKFYNYPKNGVADSCSIFVDDMIYRCIKPQTANNARAVLYEPNKDNCGAGCTQAAGYFKSHNAWYPKMSDAHTGDKIFFKKSNGQIYHTGIVVDWDNKGIYTVEGNVDGGKVAKRFYAYGDGKVAGFGRPKYTAYKKAEDSEPSPAPAPAPEPSYEEYIVRVNTRLNVRSGASTSYPIKYQLKNGERVKVYEKKNGWGRISEDRWVCMDYLKKS